MALIKCPHCGKEISDKAKMCPRCGRKFERTNVEGGELRGSEIVSSTSDCQSVIFEKSGIEKVDDEEGDIQGKKRKKKVFIILGIALIIGILGVVLYNKLYINFSSRLTDREKIEQYIPKLMGEMDETHTITTPMELFDIIEDGFELFGMDGVIEGSWTEEGDARGISDVVIWTTKDKCSESDVEHVQDVLNEIYGGEKINGENLEVIGETISEYVQWNSDEYNFIVSGMNSKEKLMVIWYANLDKLFPNKEDEDVDEERDDEEIGNIEEYTGVFNEKAKEYQSIADAFFSEELEQQKETLAEFGGGSDCNFEWSLEGTFNKGINYYYLYEYTDITDMADIEHHILIRVNSESMIADNATPVQWIQDEIDQLDEIWNE